MADKIIPIRKPPPEPRYFLHECRNGDFMLRDDGAIICSKCEKEVYWHSAGGWVTVE